MILKSWVLTIIALSAALLLHAAALLLIETPEGSRPDTDNASVHPQTVMTSKSESALSWEEELADIISIRKPELFALPDYVLGFSSPLAKAVDKPHKEPTRYRLQLNYAEPPESLPLNIECERLPFDKLVQKNLTLPPLKPTMRADLTLLPVPEDIIWRFPEGTVITGLPNQLPSNLEEIAAEEGVNNLTRLEFLRGQNSLRMRLRDSSGNAVLDNFAMRLLGREIAMVDTRVLPSADAKSQRILSLEPHSSRSVEIDWRAAVDDTKLEAGEESSGESDGEEATEEQEDEEEEAEEE